MEAIVELIQTVGFPIVGCIALFWKMNDQDKQHKEEMAKMSEVVNQNTLAIQRLVAHLGKETDD